MKVIVDMNMKFDREIVERGELIVKIIIIKSRICYFEIVIVV